MTDRLNNSWSRDERFTGRIGWTPKHGDEYVLSYSNLKGQKGVSALPGTGHQCDLQILLGLAVLEYAELLSQLQYPDRREQLDQVPRVLYPVPERYRHVLERHLFADEHQERRTQHV